MTGSEAGAPDGSTGGRAALVYGAAVLAVLGYCALQVGMHIGFAILPDGSNWQQGDWLINSRLVPIRRGLFGSALIGLSDLTGIGLLTVTIAVQLGLLAALLGALAAVFLPVRDRVAHLLLLASPGFVPLFWGNDPNGALRKEMVAFLALALLVLALRRQDRWLHGLSAALLALSFHGNEFCVLFAPLFVGASVFAGWRRRRERAWLVTSALVVLAAAHALGWALLHARAESPWPICAPLLQRGLSVEMCGGAIAYLAEGAAANAAQVSGYIRASGMVRILPLAALMALAGPAYVLALTDRPGRLALACGLAALPFLALYPVAVDWGRWLGIQAFCAVIVIVIALESGAVRLVRAPQPVLAMLLLAIGLLVSPDHAMRTVRGGVLPELAVDLRLLSRP